MSTWWDRLRQEASALASAPALVAAALLVGIALVWLVLHWTYGKILSDKDNHIMLLERSVADYRDAVDGATPEDARQRIEALRKEAASLRLRLQPRRLTPAQRQAIVDQSRLPGGAQPRAITVAHEEPCGDCAALAADFAVALGAERTWTVITRTVTDVAERPRTGLAIRVSDPLRPPPDAVVLRQALRSAGLNFLTVGNGAGPEVQLLITERALQ
jgi:hypothetical protein